MIVGGFADFGINWPGILCGKLGRKNTVLVSLAATFFAMFLSLAGGPGRVWVYFVSFALLGIGNTVIQAALPALMSNVVPQDQLTSRISLGQFVKAVCAALTPVFVYFTATTLGNWKLLFPLYGALTFVAAVWLWFTPIRREEAVAGNVTFGSCLSQLASPYILAMTLGVFFSVAADVGFSYTIPDYLKHLKVSTELAGMGPTVYFIAKTAGAFIGAILFAIEMLMRNCEFHVEPAGDSSKDKECAEFVESCMNDMERTWTDTLSEILSFLTYGWSYHEIVYKRRIGKTSSPITNSKHTDGLIGWRKLPIRAQDTLYGWEYKDDTDELVGMTQAPPPHYDRITIPLNKALHFRTRSRKDNPEGRSILRTAYRAYYFKKRLEEIEGYGMERDLAGFPVLYGPSEMDLWDSEDPEMVQILARAEAIVSSIRRDAREGLVLPGGFDEGTGWKLELLSSGSRRQFDTNQIIDRYDKRIATSVLADFVMMGQQQVGSFALADSKTKIFALAIGTYLDVICEVFNNQAIPRLIDINGDHFKGITDYPQMKHGDIEDIDLEQFATYLEKMVGLGIIVPDEELEEEVRRVGGLPEKGTNAAPKEVQPGADEKKSPQKPTGATQSREKNKAEEIPSDDEKDAREAEKARKSLGRSEPK